MRPPSSTCAQTEHIALDHLPHRYDVNGTLVASSAVAEATALGLVVTRPKRSESPNGLAWPGVAPPHRYWLHR